jgi:hypothetical protein
MTRPTLERPFDFAQGDTGKKAREPSLTTRLQAETAGAPRGGCDGGTASSRLVGLGLRPTPSTMFIFAATDEGGKRNREEQTDPCVPSGEGIG